MSNEVINFSINLDQDSLIDYFYTLKLVSINETHVSHKSEFEKTFGVKIKSNKVGDFKKEIAGKVPSETHVRTDLIAECDKNFPIIKNLLDKVSESIYGAKFGLVAYFLQKRGEDVLMHQDYPYRKNSLLVIPLYGSKRYNFPKSNAVTYYKNGGEYQILEPVIMNVMESHAVKNIDVDRLSLHIEIPNLSIYDINNILL